MTTYEVTVGFNGFIGVEETYTVNANNIKDAEQLALFQASEDLYADSVEEIDDGEYDVVVNFNGYIGSEETYTVYADSEDEAESEAISEATNDLEVIDTVEMIDENNRTNKLNEFITSKEASKVSKKLYDTFDEGVDHIIEWIESDFENNMGEDDFDTWLNDTIENYPNYFKSMIGAYFNEFKTDGVN